MKVCAICSKPLPSGRSKYCGDPCYFASKTVFNRRRYERDAAFAERQKAAAAAWAKVNREQRNATARERYARRKAAALAAGLVVLDAALVGRQVRVVVEDYTRGAKPVTTETVIRRLGVPVTVSLGSGAGIVLWLEAG